MTLESGTKLEHPEETHAGKGEHAHAIQKGRSHPGHLNHAVRQKGSAPIYLFEISKCAKLFASMHTYRVKTITCE